MATVGIFAGRGDVVLAMALALVLGFILGYKTNSIIRSIKQKFSKKETK